MPREPQPAFIGNVGVGVLLNSLSVGQGENLRFGVWLGVRTLPNPLQELKSPMRTITKRLPLEASLCGYIDR